MYDINDHYFTKVITFAAISLTIGIAYLKLKNIWFAGDYILKVILGIAIITFITMLTSRTKIENKANKFLGSISYEVFLIHGFVMELLIHIKAGISSGLFILLTVSGTILTAAALNVLDENIFKKIRVY